MAFFNIEGKSVRLGGPDWFKPSQATIDWSVNYARQAFVSGAGFEKKDMAAAFFDRISSSMPTVTLDKASLFIGQVVKELGRAGFIRYENSRWIPADEIPRMQRAPITNSQRAMLEARAADVAGTAKARGICADGWSIRAEISSAKNKFELGCWLYFYRNTINLSFEDKVDCVWRLMDGGVGNPSYDFHTVFEFGEREFDSIFEFGDADEIIFELKARLEGNYSDSTKSIFVDVFGDKFSDVEPFRMNG